MTTTEPSKKPVLDDPKGTRVNDDLAVTLLSDRQRRAGRRRTRRLAATAALAGAVVVAMLGQPPAAAQAATSGTKLTPQVVAPTPPGKTKPKDQPLHDDAAAAALKAPPAAPTWPAAGITTVSMSSTVDPRLTARAAATAPGMPIALSAPGTPGAVQPKVLSPAVVNAVPASVRVQNRDHATAVAAGHVMEFSLARSDGSAAAGKVNVSVSYASFAHAYGGDWSNRLRLVEIPACACPAIAVPFSNSAASQAVTATVVLPAGARDIAASSDLVGAGVVTMALTSGPSSGAGDFTASSPKSSSTWQAGNEAGSFNWSYPLPVPPSLGGPAPDLAINYDSQAVDGEMATSNNQPGMIGEGFSLDTGSITRAYKACSDDMGQDAQGHHATNTVKTGDLCWGTFNATMSLAGHSGELIRDDATGVYKLKDDDGTRIEHLTGASNGDGGTAGVDGTGEYWKVTTTNGTQYFFGLNHITGWATGNAVTNSTDLVPVFGNHLGEPCYNATFASGFCSQAWQWNLDYVVDPYGNTMSLWYQKETNHYARDNTTTSVSAYDRASYLLHIDYGTDTHTGGKDSDLGTVKAPDTVVVGVKDRCITAGATCVQSNPSNWPDVPWDQACSSTTSCTDSSPTFFTQKRVDTVTTEFWDTSPATPKYQPVNVWTLHQNYPDPGDGTRAGLWLQSISHQGQVGGTANVPDVTFGGQQLHNRVGIAGDQQPVMNWWRVQQIITETGEQISVVYDQSNPRSCSVGNTPASPDSNTMLCYPIYWIRPLGTTPTIDWFNKWVVKSVTDNDLTGDGAHTSTSYSYGVPAWHYSEDNGLIPPSQKTWADWRGFSTVTTTVGDAGDAQQSTKYLYFQGMNGDKTSTGTRTVKVTDSTGAQVDDDNAFAGVVREQITYNGPGGAEVSGVINDMWKSAATSTRVVNGFTVSAYHTATAATRTRTDLDAGRGLRQTEIDTTFNTNGHPTQVWDKGDTSITTDDTCQNVTYLSNTTAWIIDVQQRVQDYALPCGTNPATDADVVADVENSFDGQAYGSTPTKGRVTTVQTAKTWTTTAETWLTSSTAQFDAYGRATNTADVRGNHTVTTFTPATGGPLTATSTTFSSGDGTITGWTESKTIQPAWGAVTESKDLNGFITDVAYDPLGRVTAVWKPNRSKSAGQTANTTYAYQISNTAHVPSVVTTGQLNALANYVTSYVLYDGLGRIRQTQAPADNGGRLITDKFFDTTGAVAKESGPYTDGSAASGVLFPVPLDVNVATQTVTTYDGVGRVSASSFVSAGISQWSTQYAYGGDYTAVTPPQGGTATATYSDARGHTVELRQYPGATPTGSVYNSTRYTYNAQNQLLKVVDDAASGGSGPANQWTYTYDLLGRTTASTEPDTLTATGGAGGVTQSTYDDAGDLLTTTDPMGQVLTNGYDAIGRRTSLSQGTTLLDAWTYDTAGKNHLASSTRYVGGATGSQYIDKIVGYNNMYQVGQRKITIPASEGALAGTYTFSATYNIDGSPNTITDPALGDLASEVLTYVYDPVTGRAVRMTSSYGGVKDLVDATTYTSFGEQNITTFADSATSPWVQQGLTWDPATHRLSEAKTQQQSAPVVLADVNYTYDNSGNLTKAADTPQGGTADTQCFTYDALQRLTGAWTPTNGNCTVAPTVAGLGGAAPYWQSWTFDTTGAAGSVIGSTGDRLTATDHAAAGDTTASYTYPLPGGGQPHGPASVTTTGPGGTTNGVFSYNKDGQTTGRPGATGPQTLTWNPEGGLAGLTESANTYSYKYDANGARLLAADPTGTTAYLGDTELRLTAATQVKTATRYYTYNGQTIAQRTGAGLQFLTGDPHGTSNVAVADTAAQTDVHRYQTPYGGARGAAVSWTGTKTFVGGDQDPTGLIHEGAREYDPVGGRFISRDPVLDFNLPQQLNAYAYAGNNPVANSDATGLMLEDAGGGAGGGGDFIEIYANGTVLTGSMNFVTGDVRLNIDGIDIQPRDVNNNPFKFAAASDKQFGNYKDYDSATRIIHSLRAGCEDDSTNCSTQFEIAIEHADTARTQAIMGCDATCQAAAQDHRDGMGIALTADAMGLGAKLGGGGQAEDTVFARARTETANELEELESSPLCKNSFAPDTPVLMADGTVKPIADIRIGDKVRASDPATGAQAGKTVTFLHANQDDDLSDVSVATPAGRQTIHTTQGHLFWNVSRGQWTIAGVLSAGDRLRAVDGTDVRVLAVHNWSASHEMRNLTVEDLHTYYVLAGGVPILVHNEEPCGIPVPTAKDLHAMVPENSGLTFAQWGKKLWGTKAEGAKAALGRTAQEWLDLGVDLNKARALRAFYQDAVDRGLGRDTAPERVVLFDEAIRTLGG